MSWRDRLELAFFRDVPFSVKRADTQIGRRTAVHEYAQRDDAWPEDMGRLTRRFSIEAFIVGENYDRLRDDLIEALETAGPGELVHPYYGRKNVALASPVRISESAVDEGGIARFSFEFIEAGDNTQPGARIDTREEIDAAAGDARQAAANDFKLSFVVGGKAGFVEGSALAAVQSIVTALNGVRNGMIPDLTVLTDYVSAAKALAGSAAGILRAPVDLANSILGLVAGVRGLAIAPGAAIDALSKLFSYGDDEAKARPIPRTTPSRIAQANNAVAINRLVKRAAVIEAVVASSRVEFESHDQAIKIRNALGDQLDTLAEDAADPVYRTLAGLRAAMVADIGARGADLARIDHATLPQTMPALVVAHRLYGDATRADEIVTRNRGIVRHPGFVPGGTPLEILRG